MATKKKQTSKTSNDTGAKVAAAGVAAAAAAAAGYYYFYGTKRAKQHRAAAGKWAHNMKAEVIKEAKKVKTLDEKAMRLIVDRAAKVYQDARSVDAGDVIAAASELKKNWKLVARELTPGGKAAKKTAKKAVKKAVKKASKKVAKAAKRR